jgi:flagellar biosynthesis/type III secretory pathway M-ring protein FliF/YscJ
MDAMDVLQRYLNQIKTQLAALTVSQRLLIGLLVVVMAATIYAVVLASAKPDMVDLFPGASMQAEDVAKVKSYLQGRYTYEVSGNQILVPAAQAYAIRGELAASQTLPKNLADAFDKLSDESDFTHTPEDLERRWNNGLQTVLSRVISNFPALSEATVVISKSDHRMIGTDSPSSAVVNVVTRNGEALSQNVVLAIVDTVCGSVHGMRREDVRVTDGSRSYRAPSDDTPMPADLLAYKKSLEESYTTKLVDHFEYLGNVKIAVNVVPDMSSKKVDTKAFDPKVVKADTQVTTTEQSSTTGGGATSGDPGVRPNVGVSAAPSGGPAGNSSTTSNSDTTTDVRFPEKDTVQVVPAGTEITDMTASISVPRSYFVALLQQQKGDPKLQPTDDDKDLAALIKTQMKSILAQAKNVIGAKTDDQVVVDYFYDLPVAAAGAETVAAARATSFTPVVLGQYAKQGMLGLLAVGVLGMMLMMVKKAVPAPALAGVGGVGFGGDFGGSGGGGGSRRQSEPGMLDVQDDVLGEAGEVGAVLTGVELDDDTLKSRKIVDEVSTMVKDSPENAAALVKRWMAKGK